MTKVCEPKETTMPCNFGICRILQNFLKIVITSSGGCQGECYIYILSVFNECLLHAWHCAESQEEYGYDSHSSS